MPSFDRHCRDCERLLGDRHEIVNKWMDELYALKGARHRRFRHHWGGVVEAARRFGPEGARAAIVHVVRDCGAVPQESDYEIGHRKGIVALPAFIEDFRNEQAQEEFAGVVQENWVRLIELLPQQPGLPPEHSSR